MSQCYCDYEMPSFFREKFVRAKKQHKCCECHQVINIGDTYQYVIGKWDGEVQIYKSCEKCANLRDSLNDVSCPYYRGLGEEYWEYLVHSFPSIDAVREQFYKVFKPIVNG